MGAEIPISAVGGSKGTSFQIFHAWLASPKAGEGKMACRKRLGRKLVPWVQPPLWAA